MYPTSEWLPGLPVLCCDALCPQAQALLQQLERRKLYKYVSEVTLDVNAQQRYTAGGKPSAEEIVSYQSSAHTGVSICNHHAFQCVCFMVGWVSLSSILLQTQRHTRPHLCVV